MKIFFPIHWLVTCFSVLHSSPLSFTYGFPGMSYASSAPKKSQTPSILFNWIYNLICMHLHEMGTRRRPFFFIVMNFRLRRMMRPQMKQFFQFYCHFFCFFVGLLAFYIFFALQMLMVGLVLNVLQLLTESGAVVRGLTTRVQ